MCTLPSSLPPQQRRAAAPTRHATTTTTTTPCQRLGNEAPRRARPTSLVRPRRLVPPCLTRSQEVDAPPSCRRCFTTSPSRSPGGLDDKEDKHADKDIKHPSMETEKDVGLALKEVQDLHRQGKYGEALEISLGMRDWLERELGEDHPVYASCLSNIALMHKMQNELEEAVHYYAMALDKYNRAVGTRQRSYATTLNNLGLLYLSQAQQAEQNPGQKLQALGHLENAEATLREVLSIRTAILDDDDPALLTTQSNLASVLQRTGRGAEGEEMMRTALAQVVERTKGRNSPEVAVACNNLGYLLKKEERLEESKHLYEEALRIRRALYPPDHPQVIISLNNLAELCVAQGQEAEAKALQNEILLLLQGRAREGGGEGTGESGGGGAV